MTPEERARQIADDTYAQLEYGGAVLVYYNHEKKEETLEQAIAAAIREERAEAIAEEREACAQVALAHTRPTDHAIAAAAAEVIACKIRARS